MHSIVEEISSLNRINQNGAKKTLISTAISMSKKHMKQKRAFITDYVRLYALYNYGGVYLDSDVEVLKPIDKFLDDEAFSGFESRDSVPTAIMASVKGQRFMGELLHDYDDRKLILEDGSIDMTSNTIVITESCLKHGLKQNGKKQTIEGFTLYPAIYFCPNNISRVFNKPSRKSYTIITDCP